MQLANTLFVEKKEGREVGLSERFTLVYRSLQNCVSTAEGERDGLAEEI